MYTSCNEDNNIKNTAQIYLSNHGSAWNVHFDDIPQKKTNWAASAVKLFYVTVYATHKLTNNFTVISCPTDKRAIT